MAIANSGDIEALNYGIQATTAGAATGMLSNAGIAIANFGDITSRRAIFIGTGGNAIGNYSNTGIAVANAGVLDADVYGVVAFTMGNATGMGSNFGIAIADAGPIDAGRRGISVQLTAAPTAISAMPGSPS